MSGIVMGILAGIFIAAVYLIGQFSKRQRMNQVASATWMQKHVIVVGVFAVMLPLLVGAVLVNTVFGTITERRKIRKAVKRDPTPMGVAPQKPEPTLKLIISDGSQETNISVLNRCAYNEVTIIQDGVVQCASEQSPEVRAWFADAKLQEDLLLKKFIAHKVKQKTYEQLRKQFINAVKKKNIKPIGSKKVPKVMQQNLFLLNQPVENKTVITEKTITKKKPFKDRHAEIFYFLALVLGVLGKYFWDYYEDKRIGKDVSFQPHLIVMSFIIAALVYYSIQQGIEKEASKLTTRGTVFAFNSGFMWQTILTSMNRSKNGHAAQPEENTAT